MIDRHLDDHLNTIARLREQSALIEEIAGLMIRCLTAGGRIFWLGNGGYEYSLALAALALVFTFLGAGRLAIDGLFRRPKDEDDAALTGTTQ